jgi:hypothetical protein
VVSKNSFHSAILSVCCSIFEGVDMHYFHNLLLLGILSVVIVMIIP